MELSLYTNSIVVIWAGWSCRSVQKVSFASDNTKKKRDNQISIIALVLFW